MKKLGLGQQLHRCACGRLATVHIKAREYECTRCKDLENRRKLETDRPKHTLSKWELIWNLGLPVNF